MENQKKCQFFFKENPLIKVQFLYKKVPNLYENFSSGKIITMEFIDGISLSDKKLLVD